MVGHKAGRPRGSTGRRFPKRRTRPPIGRGKAEADFSVYQPPIRELGLTPAACPGDPKERIPGCGLMPTLMGLE